MDLTTLVPWFVTGIVGIGGILRWLHDLRSNAEYRAAQERIVAAKDAQLAQIQETVKSKDTEIETLKILTYADALRHITAQKELHDLRVKDLTEELERAYTEDPSDEKVAALRAVLDVVELKEREYEQAFGVSLRDERVFATFLEDVAKKLQGRTPESETHGS